MADCVQSVRTPPEKRARGDADAVGGIKADLSKCIMAQMFLCVPGVSAPHPRG
ncbi:Hypothetical protein SMAX5B_007919 [Scophthalmus maximus]|uniref:Uncharacterized protein n=1 Tax=Scophthalmus maximus TaxID=52904 RepID=A0A2U9C4G0_SCOMX|nr:Hypothetical protein SMAX5B_007919 [Scophthalmus maximus]